jgi:predicted NACHT family NTPase
VWSKTPIATDDETGDLTTDSRNILKEFVERIFGDRLGGDKQRILWFKNWAKLQSVRALEHFHVLVRNASKEDIEFWIGNSGSH